MGQKQSNPITEVDEIQKYNTPQDDTLYTIHNPDTVFIDSDVDSISAAKVVEVTDDNYDINYLVYTGTLTAPDKYDIGSGPDELYTMGEVVGLLKHYFDLVDVDDFDIPIENTPMWYNHF